MYVCICNNRIPDRRSVISRLLSLGTPFSPVIDDNNSPALLLLCFRGNLRQLLSTTLFVAYDIINCTV